MQLLRWEPFGMMRELDRLLDRDFATGQDRPWTPRIDVLSEDGLLKIRAEVPGVPIDAIDITVKDGALTMSGSRSFHMIDEGEGYYRKELMEGTFSRTVFLPDTADIDAIEATSLDGVIEISVPNKAEVLPKTVKVAIK